MTAHNASRNDARSRARERMLELNRARAERDVRIEQAVTAALVTLDQRRAAQQAVHAATDELVTALRQLVGEQVSVEGAATLTGIELTELRRLLREQPASRPSQREARAATKPARLVPAPAHKDPKPTDPANLQAPATGGASN